MDNPETQAKLGKDTTSTNKTKNTTQKTIKMSNMDSTITKTVGLRRIS